MIYRLSARGRRGSQAAKRHNTNLRFATAEVTAANRAHPGDGSRVVEIVVSADEYHRLFTNRGSQIADLRALRGPVLVGDCNRNGQVVIDELIRGVNIALGGTPVSECTPFDRVADGRATVDELVRGVGNATLARRPQPFRRPTISRRMPKAARAPTAATAPKIDSAGAASGRPQSIIRQLVSSPM